METLIFANFRPEHQSHEKDNFRNHTTTNSPYDLLEF